LSTRSTFQRWEGKWPRFPSPSWTRRALSCASVRREPPRRPAKFQGAAAVREPRGCPHWCKGGPHVAATSRVTIESDHLECQARAIDWSDIRLAPEHTFVGTGDRNLPGKLRHLHLVLTHRIQKHFCAANLNGSPLQITIPPCSGSWTGRVESACYFRSGLRHVAVPSKATHPRSVPVAALTLPPRVESAVAEPRRWVALQAAVASLRAG
jgi:hypothetical protein